MDRSPHEEVLRRLATRDDQYLELLVADPEFNERLSQLDTRTHSLARLAALVAVDAAPPSYMEAIATARTADVSEDEIVGCLVAVVAVVGVPRVVSAAPKLALALGYDLDSILESHARTLDDDRAR
jgi:alkylhydroperoxidase/carboxymuconolactone decarboxylase family protein YurZ